jgi:hypothetical protein
MESESTRPSKPIPHSNHGHRETFRYLLSSIRWPNSYHSTETHRDREIEDRVPGRNAQTTSHHANGASNAPRSQPQDSDHPNLDTPDGNQNNGANTYEVDHGSNNDSDDADDEVEDEETEVNGPKQRRPRTFNGDIRPSQLRFYSGSWVDVLILAKNNYRLFIHSRAVNPFPERTAASLEDAHVCLIDAIAKFREETKLRLDEGIMLKLNSLVKAC